MSVVFSVSALLAFENVAALPTSMSHKLIDPRHRCNRHQDCRRPRHPQECLPLAGRYPHIITMLVDFMHHLRHYDAGDGGCDP